MKKDITTEHTEVTEAEGGKSVSREGRLDQFLRVLFDNDRILDTHMKLHLMSYELRVMSGLRVALHSPPFVKGGRGGIYNRLKIPLNPPLQRGT